MSSMCFLSLRFLSTWLPTPLLIDSLLLDHHQVKNTKLNLEELERTNEQTNKPGGEWILTSHP